MKIIKRISLILLVLLLIGAGLVYGFRSRIIAHIIPSVEQVGDIFIEVKNDTCYISSKLTVRNKTFLKIEIDTIKYQVLLFNKVYLQSRKSLGIKLAPNGMGKSVV